jgi:predicted PurR-regulated permease PerM
MKALLYSTVLFFIPLVSTFAQTGLAAGDPRAGKFGPFIGAIINFINDILFPLALAIAFIFLVWGIVKYFVIGGYSDDGKKNGKDLIIYSVVGFVVILSFYGIINILTNGLGFGGQSLQQIPDVPKKI